MLCTVVSAEDDILTVKVRNPDNKEYISTVYQIKMDERLREFCEEIQPGDVISIRYYFKLSERGVNLSYKIRDINVNNSLQIR